MNEASGVVAMNEDATGDESKSKKPGKPRGFAAMNRDLVRKFAQMGGKAVHARGTGHRFTREQAIEAGRKGGSAPHVRRGRNPVSEGK